MDDDAGDNGSLFYSIVFSHPEDHFVINSKCICIHSNTCNHDNYRSYLLQPLLVKYLQQFNSIEKLFPHIN